MKTTLTPQQIAQYREAGHITIEGFLSPDELAKWRYAETAFDMLQFGLRLGAHPRQLITTTPRPTPLLKRLLNERSTVVTRAPTKANAYHLAPTFLENVLTRYAGTRLGRQEIDGELIDLDRRTEIVIYPGALKVLVPSAQAKSEAA